MFNWFKRKPPPPAPTHSKANPGQGVQASIAFSNGNRTWTEEVHLVRTLAEVLEAGAYSFSREKSWVQLDSGLILQPGLVALQPVQRGGVQTVTTVEVSHPAGIPSGVFEYQHSFGEDTRRSLTKGFEGWMQLDLPVFLDALRPKPEHCTFMEMDLPAQGSSPCQKRRVVLGPVSHLVTREAKESAEEHPFCPCCLFTHSIKAMEATLLDGCFYGVRLFAARDDQGAASADCRLNGEDWEAGKTALMEYAKTWPDRGVEFRKQYVIIQNRSAASPPGS